MSHRTSVHDLKSLVLSFHSLIAVETVEEERVRSILGEVAMELHLPMYEWSMTSGLRRAPYGMPLAETHGALEVLRYVDEQISEDTVVLLKDFAPHLATPDVCRALRELAQKLMRSRSALVLTGEPLTLPPDLERLSARFDLKPPDEGELRAMVRQVLDAISQRQQVVVDLTKEDAQRLVQALSGLTLNQARNVIAQAIVYDNKLSALDIERVLHWKAEIIERGGLLELFPLEENRYELGGFARLKEWLDHARAGFTREARALNLRPPKGLLFVGVQGCGKSLAAKFIAREWRLPLLKLDASRLYEKYVGESEKNFRRATQMAEAMAPIVLWIDEIEKAFAYGTNSDTDGGLSQRLFGSFLTWLQEKRDGVFVVGAANDLTRTPPELLRKGRFDEVFFVDLPTADERRSVLVIHLRLRKQDPNAFDLARLAEATEGFSGAEIEQAIVSSLYRAVYRRVQLTTEDVLESIRATVPLSAARREDIARIREIGARFARVS